MQNPNPKTDRREDFRLEVQLRCALTVSGGKLPGRFVGVTENISRRGILIQWTTEEQAPPLPQVAEQIALALEWPANGRPEPRSLYCWGNVVRVSTPAGEPPRVAVRVLRMEFAGVAGSGASSLKLAQPGAV